MPFDAVSMTAFTPNLFLTFWTWVSADERDENAPNWTPAEPGTEFATGDEVVGLEYTGAREKRTR